MAAHVLNTYKEKEHRTEAMTYTATVKVLDIYKGGKLLRNIRVVKPHVYNVSNFGDRKMCYADVTEGENYILFLTTYKQRLSAKYDDIFGASTKYTEKNALEVERQVGEGVSDWLEWSSCSKSCDQGYQVRKRNCTGHSDDCNPDTMDKRSCNSFSCNNIHDLLHHLGVYKLPLGVYHVHDRPGAFNITQSAKLYAPLSEIFPYSLPHKLSLMLSIKFSPTYSGYFFTLSDLAGNQRFALKFDSHSNTNDAGRINVEIYNVVDLDTLNEVQYDVDSEISVNDWHWMALKIEDNNIDLYIDCELVISKTLTSTQMLPLNSNLMIAIGAYFDKYGKGFQGQIEQLVITDDADSAQLHCSTELDHIEDRAIKDEGNNHIIDIEDSVNTTESTQDIPDDKIFTKTDLPSDIEDTTTAVVEFSAEWTEWSPCSRSCGRGVQTRTLYCGDNVISTCIHAGFNSVQNRWCYIQPCKVLCRKNKCLNGGRCIANDICACPVGYTGNMCQTAICNPPCGNGGQCVQPGYCSCPYGYMPPNCDPVCVLPCKNKGRCVGPNKCKCKKGYVGADCSTPVCRRGCYNGGRCVSPGKCSCPQGFTGTRCHKPVCNPKCKNNGRCLYPGICQCKRGYNGPLCENLVCRKFCQNGGYCSGNNRCTCPEGYRGRWCHKLIKYHECQAECLNGGRCRKGRCRCLDGFTGTRCEKRHCQYETYLRPYLQTFKKLEPRDVATLCGPWRWMTCLETRMEVGHCYHMLVVLFRYTDRFTMTHLKQKFINCLTMVDGCLIILVLLSFYNQNVYAFPQDDILQYAFNDSIDETTLTNGEFDDASENINNCTLLPEIRLANLCSRTDTIDRSQMTSPKFTKMALNSIRNDGTVVVNIHAYDQSNTQRISGDDVIVVWAVEKNGDGRVSGEVIDHKNGSYTGIVKVFWSGPTLIRSRLVSSIINTCLKMKALKKYGNAVFSLRQGFGIRGTFKRKHWKELTPCGANPTIFGYTNICNFTALNDGMSWFCGKPKKEYLNCSHIFSFGTGRFDTKWVTQQEKIRNKGHGIILSFVDVDIQYESNFTRTMPCKDIPPEITWSKINPSGLWYNNTWQTPYCEHVIMSKLEHYRKCLSGKTFVILGDSTNRQYADFIVQKILGINGKFIQNQVGVHGQYHNFENKFTKDNITVIYLKHEMPYHNPGFTKSGIISIPNLIDKYASQNISDLVLLANYNTHYTAYPISIYRDRQRALKEAYQRLSIANPTAKLFLKTPHLVVVNNRWFDPYRQLVNQQIIRQEFADMRDKIVLLDTWTISVTHDSRALHPFGRAMLSQILQFMAYLC
ncbi:Neurexophilin [Mactra antiquata]